MNDKWCDLYPNEAEPEMYEVDVYVESSVWEALRSFIESTFQAKPLFAFSKCSMEPGWNIKYRKRGKALCTIYPKAGYVTCLISIGLKQLDALYAVYDAFDDEVKSIYENSERLNGSKWLMIDVKSEAILEDVKKLIMIRYESK